MANLAGILGGLGQGYFEGQDQALMRQQRLYAMQQQALADQQAAKVRAGMGLGIEAIQQPPPQQQQAPQAPPPGQSSQPMQPPPKPLQMPPQFQIPGMMQPPPQGGQQQPPPLGAPGGQKPLPPWTSPQPPNPAQMQSQQQSQMPQGIQPPPQAPGMGQQQAPDLKTVMKKLMRPPNNLDGETAFQVAQRLEPMMSMEGRMQLLAAKQEIDRLKAEATQKRADTGAGELERKKAFDAGESKRGGAVVDRTNAQTAELGARAAKENRGGNGAGGMKPGKPVVFQSEDGKSYSRVLMSDGSIVVRDDKGRVVEDGVRPKGSAGQETMRRTVELDLSEIDMSLKNMSKDMTQTSSLFFMDHAEKGAVKRWSENKLTPTEMQLYDVYSNRIASAIAGIQSMGRGQVSDEKIKQAQKLVPQPGDDQATIKTKLAYIKGIRDNAAAIMSGKKADDIKDDKVVDFHSLK